MLADKQKEKLNEFRNVFIEYPIITTVFNDFDRLRLGKGLAGEKPCMLLNGDTGVIPPFLMEAICRISVV
ncbi:hypothetical protein [Pseudoalteromonas sp.]|uniref:hypothetical protein n=1 Tax=Pseudoalteromonas sp. TaxID=53249 RepID=UPI0023554FE1|nr:hypothetical protein [Pseudoalteromonas sp.]